MNVLKSAEVALWTIVDIFPQRLCDRSVDDGVVYRALLHSPLHISTSAGMCITWQQLVYLFLLSGHNTVRMPCRATSSPDQHYAAKVNLRATASVKNITYWAKMTLLGRSKPRFMWSWKLPHIRAPAPPRKPSTITKGIGSFSKYSWSIKMGMK
jgi:hypothetical protein